MDPKIVIEAESSRPPTDTLVVNAGAASSAVVLPDAADAAEVTLRWFERLAQDPNISVEKIERLLDLWHREQVRRAQTAFYAAMAAAQAEMRVVAKDMTNPQTHSRYASYEALDAVLRPIYTAHGFALSFDTGGVGPDVLSDVDEAVQPASGSLVRRAPTPPDHVRVVCEVSHRDGHAKTYHADVPAEMTGLKGTPMMTRTHAFGSALTYGQRYLLRLIFNIATGDKRDKRNDDDGNAASAPPPPEGYEAWLMDLSETANEGTSVLRERWQLSHHDYRRYLAAYDHERWEQIKARAATV